MINQLLSRAFIISNKKFDISFQQASVFNYGNSYVTVFNAVSKENAVKNGCTICFDTMKLDERSGWVEYGVSISGDTLTVRNNQMNTRDIYFVFEPERNLFVLFNSLLIAREILIACGLPVTYSSEKIHENGSHFKYVKLLQYSEAMKVTALGGKVAVSCFREGDILDETAIDAGYSLNRAQEKFYAVLLNATQRLTDGHDEVSIPLSGGIDSGTIAYLLTQLKKNVTAYSVGTEWGNEYEDAKSTADFIGVALNEVFVTRDDIVKEIPGIIAAFGFNDASNIEISLVPQCLFRKVQERERDKPVLFATGFGSDLLNAGIYKPFNTHQELRNDILSTLKKTRLPTETYSNLFFRNNSMYDSINVVHPFWDPAVIAESLKIAPEFKVKESRDKYFFRKMMENRLGMHNSWRKKRAAHHGTGIGFNLKKVLRKGEKQISEEAYESYYKSIHKEIFFRNNFSILS